jgi:hypothetical protein
MTIKMSARFFSAAAWCDTMACGITLDTGDAPGVCASSSGVST